MTAKDIGLSRLIPLSIRERIWRKEYIDIFSLLEISAVGLDLATDKKEEEEKGKRHIRVERTFENWGHAFRTLACMMVEKFPGSATFLFLYEQKIHNAKSTYPRDAWLRYDEAFRKKMQTWPVIEWDCQDVSGYTETMVPAKEGATRGEQSFRTSWPKARVDKPHMTNQPKASAQQKAGKSKVPTYWQFDKGKCK